MDYTPVTDLNMKITIPDGSRIPVLHKGTMISNDKITLKDVLHVPDFHFHLISVSKLCKDMNSKVIFSNKHCIIQVHSQKEPLMLFGNLNDGLYNVNSIESSPTAVNCIVFLSQQSDETKLWHMRLGHLPFP